MRTSRVVALVAGVILLLPAVAMLLGGGLVLLASAAERDDDGFFDTSIETLTTDGYALVSDDVDLQAEPLEPEWFVDALDLSVRLRVEADGGEADGGEVFVGIAPTAAVRAYLADVPHDVVVDVEGWDGDRRDIPRLERRSGTVAPEPPADVDIWVASTSGSGRQELRWDVEPGDWTVVVMDPAATAGVSVDAEVGVRSGAIVPIGVFLVVVGGVLTALGVVLVVVGATGLRRTDGAAVPAPAPGAVGVEGVAGPSTPRAEPVVLTAVLDPQLSRWMWLVKWFLAIPHVVVLAFLWVAFVVLTFVAGVAILFTGRYPAGIFHFNVGVLRWTWRVSYYAFSGGLGSDRYPPFTLEERPGDHARLQVVRPVRLSRGLVLVKWWLLALPHYLVVTAFVGGPVAWETDEGRDVSWPGLLSLLVLIAAVVLLVRGRYPTGLFDLVIGLDRWVVRVVVYAALMTDEYPPFRLDQGGGTPPPLPPPSAADERR